MTANHVTTREEVLAQRAWHFSKLRERRSTYPLIGFLFLVAINNAPGALRGDVVSIVAVVLTVAAGVHHFAARPRKRGVALGVRYEFTRGMVEMKAISTDPPTRNPLRDAQNRPQDRRTAQT